MSRSRRKPNDYMAGVVAGLVLGMYLGVAIFSFILLSRGDA